MKKYTYFDIADEIKIEKKHQKDYQKQEYDSKYFHTSKIYILKDNFYGKKIGKYYSISFASLDSDKAYNSIKKETKKMIQEMVDNRNRNVLIVGIGNDDFAPDSFGPRVVKKINANYHLDPNNNKKVACLIPGVMALTGLESASIVKGVCQENNISLVIVCDSLVTTSFKRMNRVVQITNTGIEPGSGVNNYRKGINKEYLGCNVISIGVGTAIPLYYLINSFTPYKNANEESLSNILTSKEIELKIDVLTSLIAESINEIFSL